jgi:hypothetical protein
MHCTPAHKTLWTTTMFVFGLYVFFISLFNYLFYYWKVHCFAFKLGKLFRLAYYEVLGVEIAYLDY